MEFELSNWFELMKFPGLRFEWRGALLSFNAPSLCHDEMKKHDTEMEKVIYH